eukprot:g8029.t1
MGRLILAIAASGQTLEVAGAKWNNKAGSEVDKPQSKGFLAITVKPEGDALTLTPDGDVLGGQGGLNATTAAFLEAAEEADAKESEPMGASVLESDAQPGQTAAAYPKECITMTEKLRALETGALAQAQKQQDEAGKHYGLFQRVNPFLQPLATFYVDHWSKAMVEPWEIERSEQGDAAKCAFAFRGPSQADQMRDLLESIHYEMQEGRKEPGAKSPPMGVSPGEGIRGEGFRQGIRGVVFRFSGFRVFRFPGFPVSGFSGFWVFRFPGFPVSGFSGFSGFRVCRFPGFPSGFSGFSGFRVLRFSGLFGFSDREVDSGGWVG